MPAGWTATMRLFMPDCPRPARTAGPQDSLASCGPGRRAGGGGGGGPVPRRAHRGLLTTDTLVGPRGRGATGRAHGRRREIDILIGTQIVGQGPPLPQPDPGRGGRRRSRPARRRPARGRAHLSSCCPGRRPRRPRRARRAGCCCRPMIPEHAVMQALVADDRDAFVAARWRSGGRPLPPFGRLAALILSGPDARRGRPYRPRARPRGAAGAGHPGARPGARAAGPAARPPPPPLPAESRRDIAPQPLIRTWLARVQAAGQCAAAGRYRPLQLLVRVSQGRLVRDAYYASTYSRTISCRLIPAKAESRATCSAPGGLTWIPRFRGDDAEERAATRSRICQRVTMDENQNPSRSDADSRSS